MNNVIKNKMVYLGGAIDLANEGHDVRSTLISALDKFDVAGAFNPKGAFTVGDITAAAKSIVDINKTALYTCDFAVFVVERNTPSIGTPMEIEYARQKNMNHIIFYVDEHMNIDNPFIPAYLCGISNCVFAMNTLDYDSVYSAIFEYMRLYNEKYSTPFI